MLLCEAFDVVETKMTLRINAPKRDESWQKSFFYLPVERLGELNHLRGVLRSYRFEPSREELVRTGGLRIHGQYPKEVAQELHPAMAGMGIRETPISGKSRRF